MKVMIMQPTDLDHEHRPVYGKQARFDDLTVAYLAALTPRDVEVLPVVERYDGVDFDADVDVVAMTAMGVSPMARAYQIAERFRARDVPVVLGGPNFTLHCEEAKEHCDAVVLGEAENLWPQVIEDARRGSLQPFYRADALPELKGLPPPRYDFFNGRPEFKGALFTVQASRGCPHTCDFCAIGDLAQGKIRFRPVDEVIRDVKATGSKRIFFADDNMMANRAYYKELFRRLIPLKIRWVGAANLSIGRHPETLRLARKSGCVLLIVGVESIQQDTLDTVGKRFNRMSDFEQHIRGIHRAGIIAACTTIFGFDGDDPGVFDRTVDFYRRHRVRVAPFFNLTPVPGTRLWRRLRDEDRILTEDYSRYDTVSAVFQPARMSPKELEDGLLYAYQKMYKLGSSVSRLFPFLNNPVADFLAVMMNLRYAQLIRSGGFGVFNFN